MKYQRLLSAFYSQVWGLLPEKFSEIESFLQLKASGADIAEEEVVAIAGTRRPGGVQMVGRVALLPVFGTILHRISAIERSSGGVGTEELGAAIDALVADTAVKAIVMVHDSPGGAVSNIPELAQ